MEYIKVETQQNTQTTSGAVGVFSKINQYDQSKQDLEEVLSNGNFLIDLTEFKQNLKYSEEFEQIFNSNNEEAYDHSFESTLSAAEIEKDMDIEDFNDIEQFFHDENPDQFSQLLKSTEKFPVSIQRATIIDQQFVPEFQHPVMKPAFIPVPVKIPIMNENQEVIREEFECITCKKTYTALSSLTRHYKTQKHQRMEATKNGPVNYQGVQNFNFNLSQSQYQPAQIPIINQASSTIQMNQPKYQPAQIPIINQVSSTIQINQPRSLNMDQTRINFIQRLRESRRQMIDQNRMNAANQELSQSTFMVVEHDKVPSPQECIQKVDVLEEFVNFNQVNKNIEVSEVTQATTTQTSPKSSSPSATKGAIENSMKILSKLNTETSSKSSEQAVTKKVSPKKPFLKQSSFKQLTLSEMTFRKPAAVQKIKIEPESTQFLAVKSEDVRIESNVVESDLINKCQPESKTTTQPQLKFESTASAQLETTSIQPEPAQVNPESEPSKYIQSIPEDEFQIDSEEPQFFAEYQSQYEIVISSGDSIYTIKELKDPETSKQRQNNLAQLMSQKKQQRIQEDISSTSIRGYQCMYCTKCFTTTSNLRRHEHLHGAKKLHQCTVCGKEFMQKEYMKKHMTTHSRRFA